MAAPTIKRKVTDDDILEVMPIGAGNEVGRSCVLMKYKGKTIMFDCGIHPAYTGLSSLPYFDMIDDPSTIDILLISHFHLDHAAALPYFLEKTSFKGRVFMTHPTKAIYKMILTDYVKVSNIAIEEMLFDEADLIRSMEKIEQINYHQEQEHNGIKFTCYNAGHVLGAAMFLVEIAGTRVLYTGDFSRQEDRHLMGAETPPVKVDVLIVESTYGVQVHEPRAERERRFTGGIHDIVKRGGRCLIPVFALGRAQELLLILDEYWAAHPELHSIPIYYASSLAKKCMTVYQTYINMMNDRIRSQFDLSNPFKFKHISNLKSMDHFDDIGPCVVMASPGMLQSGLSRELFEKWCSDKRNGVVLPGYCVEGTLAKHIMSEPTEITSSSGVSLPLNIDFLQTSEFIDIIQPPHVILVHGDANEMSRLKGSLVTKYEGRNLQVHMPKNCQAVHLVFRAEKIAKAVGTLAAQGPKDGRRVLVQKDFSHTIMLPEELATYTQLKTNILLIDRVEMYEDVNLREAHSKDKEKEKEKDKEDDSEEKETKPAPKIISIYDSLTIQLEWTANPVNDMVADSAMALILQLEANPMHPSPQSSSSPSHSHSHNSHSHSHDHPHTKQEQDNNNNEGESELSKRMKQIETILKSQYGPIDVDEESGRMALSLDTASAVIDVYSLTVDATTLQLREKLENSLERVRATVFPIPNP